MTAVEGNGTVGDQSTTLAARSIVRDCAVGDRGIRATENDDATTATISTVSFDRAVDDGHLSVAYINPATVLGSIVRDGHVVQTERAKVLVNSATKGARTRRPRDIIAGDHAVVDLKVGAAARLNPAAVAVRPCSHSISDGQIVDRDGGGTGDVDDAEGVVAADRQVRRAETVDRRILADHQLIDRQQDRRSTQPAIERDHAQIGIRIGKVQRFTKTGFFVSRIDDVARDRHMQTGSFDRNAFGLKKNASLMGDDGLGRQVSRGSASGYSLSRSRDDGGG